MKVRAKHNVNINGVWRMGGEVFDIDSLDGLSEHIEEVGYVSEIFPPMENKSPAAEDNTPAAGAAETPKRTRRRKSAEQ